MQIIKFYLILLICCQRAYCDVSEISLQKNECIFIFFQEEDKPDSLIPVCKHTYTNDSFFGRNTCMSFEMIANDKLQLFLQVKDWKDGLPMYGGIYKYQFPNPKGVSRDSVIYGPLQINREKKFTSLTQSFTDKVSGSKYIWAAYISEDKNEIIKRVKMPEKYKSFKWEFVDQFNEYEKFKEYFKRN